MSRFALSAVALALGVLCAGAGVQPALAEKRVALVIGNSAYQHAPALPNPSRDAKAMLAMFEKAGFDVVTTQYDAGNLQFKRAIRQFEDAASEADISPAGNTLIAYAAKGGSAAEDGDATHSPFTAALLDNLFVPGLDVRLALGRVRDEVLKTTNNRQEPFVYGSLGGANIALVPA